MSQFFTEPEWPPSLAELKNVDTLLRCAICFDYLNIAMMVQQCSHNYCSLCIRKFLSYKTQCPLCHLAVTESDLKNNRALDEIVKSFKLARHELLKLNLESPPMSPQIPRQVKPLDHKKTTGVKQENRLIHQFLNKLDSPAASGQKVKCEPPERPPSDDTLEQPSTSCKVKEAAKVECPVCGVNIPEQFINKHLDSCLTRDEKKESLRSSFTKRKPMAKVVYDLLSDQEVRRRLKELGLPTQGPRQQLVKRHQEFLHMYNAQCDSLNPKTVQEIVKDVERNEKQRARLESKSKTVMLFSKNQTEEEIDEIHAQYRKQNKTAFQQLIEQVKGRQQSTPAGVKVEPDDADHRGATEPGHPEGPCGASSPPVPQSSVGAEDGQWDSSSPAASCLSTSSSCSDILHSDLTEDQQPMKTMPLRKRKATSVSECGQKAKARRTSRATRGGRGGPP
ncbi:E3 ubiquitin-protein ligase RAD18 [Erpetoichthys calabaricus]|uniref:RING-type E3 ubiquitin transferase n=1 Tax=Erpetoichthys calabaricus TaxID=27687 RepID=A0A8C4XE28_ERPCA|nr:E3 ubiquitin-protein ligase RAD18 [Erpetoichthys calabaricus]